MGLSFVDLDERIERSSGMSVSEIFDKEGEAGFRRRETQALLELVETPEPPWSRPEAALSPWLPIAS